MLPKMLTALKFPKPVSKEIEKIQEKFMEEKQIQIIIQDEIVDSFPKVYSPLGIHFYCVHNNLKLLEVLEFEAFVAVFCEFK